MRMWRSFEGPWPKPSAERRRWWRRSDGQRLEMDTFWWRWKYCENFRRAPTTVAMASNLIAMAYNLLASGEPTFFGSRYRCILVDQKQYIQIIICYYLCFIFRKANACFIKFEGRACSPLSLSLKLPCRPPETGSSVARTGQWSSNKGIASQNMTSRRQLGWVGIAQVKVISILFCSTSPPLNSFERCFQAPSNRNQF